MARIDYDAKADQIARSYMVDHYEMMEGAMTRAAHRVAAQISREGSRVISSAGFSRNWSQNLKVTVYPEGKRESLRPTVWVYHRIPYAWVFEEGATIRGNPMMFIPTQLATRGQTRVRITPRKFRMNYGPLRRVERNGKILLFGQIPGSKKGGLMFVGIPRVRIPQKWFSIERVVERASLNFPRLYFQNLLTE